MSPEPSDLGSRVSVTVAVDPALTPAAVTESVAAISHPGRVETLGNL